MGKFGRLDAGVQKTVSGRAYAYCSSVTDLTDEHVPPSSWFIDPKPDNMLTVPACRGCNAAFGRDDDEFRLSLGALVGMDTPETIEFNRTKVMPGVIKNRRQTRQVLGSTRLLMRTASGASTFGEAALFSVDFGLFCRVGQRLARGLYRFETRTSLPADTPVEVGRVGDPAPYLERIFKGAKFREKGPAFAYWHVIVDDLPTHSVWLFDFYSWLFMIAITGGLIGNLPDET